jgi:membrane protein
MVFADIYSSLTLARTDLLLVLRSGANSTESFSEAKCLRYDRESGVVFPRISLDECKEAFARWNSHNASRLGAALAFYTLLSLAPLVIFVIAIIAFVFGREHAQTWILQQVAELVGRQGADTIRNLVQHAHRSSSSGLIASVTGVITLLFGASGVFAELRSGLDTVWDFQSSTSFSWKELIKNRLFSFGMVLAIGFVLLVSLLLSTAVAALIRYFSQVVPFPAPLLETVNFIISIYVIACLFTLIFKYVPETKIDWRDGWSGAMFTALLFTLGKILLGVYLGMASVGSAYGAAGSLVAVVVWVYYSAQIFYYGAEVTWVHASVLRQRGRAGASARAQNVRPTRPPA